MQRFFDNADSDHDWSLSLPAHSIAVMLTTNLLDPDVVQRLELRHPTAEKFRHLRNWHQENPELACRIVTALRSIANRLIELLREFHGQFWLEPCADTGDHQSFLGDCCCEWRFKEADEVWKPLILMMRRMVWTAGSPPSRYVTRDDWRNLSSRLAAGGRPSTALSLVSDARKRWFHRDRQIAVIHLQEALEWCVQEFIEDRLRDVIPPKSLKRVLKQSYAHFLEDWLKPLARQAEIDLGRELQAVQDVRTYRRDAAHPKTNTGLETLTTERFEELVENAVHFMCKLLSLSVPERPKPMTAHMSSVGRERPA